MSRFLKKVLPGGEKDDAGKSFARFHSSSYEGKTFLHGHLNVAVLSARDLPDMESWLSKLVDKKDVTDAFVDVRLGAAKLVKTSIVSNSLNPVWNEEFRVEVCHFAEELVFEVKDKDHMQAEFIGLVAVPCQSLLAGDVTEGFFPIKKKHHSTSHKGTLELRIQV